MSAGEHVPWEPCVGNILRSSERMMFARKEEEMKRSARRGEWSVLAAVKAALRIRAA